MPGQKSRKKTQCIPPSCRFGVGHGANNLTLEKFTVTKPWKRQRLHKVVAPVKKKCFEQLKLYVSDDSMTVNKECGHND
jgi:hypothetical protein